MWRTIPTLLFCWLLFMTPAQGQDVFVPRELKAIPVHPVKKEAEPAAAKPVAKENAKAAEPSGAPAAKAPSAAEKPVSGQAAKPLPVKTDPPKAVAVKPPPAREQTPVAAAKPAVVKETVATQTPKAPAKEPQPKAQVAAKVPSAKAEGEKAEAAKPATVKEETSLKAAKTTPAKEPVAAHTAKAPPVKEAPAVTKVSPAKAEGEKAQATKPAAPKEQTPLQAAKAPPVKESQPSVQVATKASPAKTETAKTEAVKATPVKETAASQTAKAPPVKEQPESAPKAQPVKPDPAKAIAAKPAPAKEKAPVEAAKPALIREATQTAKAPPVKEQPTNALAASKVQPVKFEAPKEPTVNIQLTNMGTETAWTKLADGFDFPVGKPDAENYYKARGFRPNGHLGEDWDGIRGGDTDFKDPIYSIGDGIVVFARDIHMGWGNVVIVRHAYKEGGAIKHIDALYGHLHTMQVKRGQRIVRGQLVGTMGTAHGQYDAHLHFEIRKNIEIGLSKSKFQRDFSNYHDPTQFIASHRKLSGGGGNFRVALNTFTHDAAFFRFASTRNYSAKKRSTAQSAAALKRALSSTNR